MAVVAATARDDKVPDWIANCTQVWNNTVTSLQELVGEDKTHNEQQQFVDYHYLLDSDFTMQLVTSKGDVGVRAYSCT